MVVTWWIVAFFQGSKVTVHSLVRNISPHGHSFMLKMCVIDFTSMHFGYMYM